MQIIKRQRKLKYKTIGFSTFRDLDHFFFREQSVILGRAFYKLQKEQNLPLRQIARCFGYTQENVRWAISLYLKHQSESDGSPTQAPSEQGTEIACVPPSDPDDVASLLDSAGQTTEREVIL